MLQHGFIITFKPHSLRTAAKSRHSMAGCTPTSRSAVWGYCSTQRSLCRGAAPSIDVGGALVAAGVLARAS